MFNKLNEWMNKLLNITLFEIYIIPKGKEK